MFKYLIKESHPLALDWDGIEARFTGASTEVLAEYDLSAQLAQRFGADTVEELEPTFEEACSWILRNPERVDTRSRLWGQDREAQSARD